MYPNRIIKISGPGRYIAIHARKYFSSKIINPRKRNLVTPISTSGCYDEAEVCLLLGIWRAIS